MKRIITFSFDDGSFQDRRLVALLNQYGLCGTFNLNSGSLVQPGKEGTHVRADEIRSLYAGHEVAVHTVTHPHLTTCDDDRIRYEIAEDKVRLEALSGQAITGMAYPYGHIAVDSRVVALTRDCGILWARSTESTHRFGSPDEFLLWNPTCKMEDPALEALWEQFLTESDQTGDAEDGVRLFYTWTHSFEMDKYASWDRAEAFFASVAAAKDRVVCMTNGEVYRYLTEESAHDRS